MGVNYNPQIVIDSSLVTALDFANQKSFSTNTHPSPLDIYGWYVLKRGNSTASNCTISRDTTTTASPAGGIPMKMVVTGLDPYIPSWGDVGQYSLSTAANNQTWKVSVYAKSNIALPDCELFIFAANNLGRVIDSTTGLHFQLTQKTLSVTTEWQRFEHTITFNYANTAYIQSRLDGPNSGANGNIVWWDGWQVEPYNTTKFNPNTNTNYTQIKNMVNAGVGTIAANSLPQYSSNSFIILDGVNDEITANVSVALIKDFTLDFWMKSAAVVQGRGIIEYGSTTYGIIGAYRLQTNSSLWYFATVGGTGIITLTKNLADNIWHHCVMTYDGTTAKVYIDNNLEGSLNTGLSGNLRATTTTNLNIGRWRGDPTFQDGSVGPVKLYNRVLNEGEIQQNFNALRGRYGI
jgi:uncharacterized protein YjhX (UPF0386 family)